MTAVVIRGDARQLPLPDASVDLIVTSPPYFGLRSYTDTCRICLDIRANGFDPAETLVDYDEHVRRSHHYDGQIGSEATPQEWVAALVDCTREWMRVLKPSGSLFVNLGDKYAAGHGGSSTEGNGVNLTKAVWNEPGAVENAPHLGAGGAATHKQSTPRVVVPGTRPKSLLGLPWRYAIACTDQLGLTLRRDIIWNKPNGLPESVTDRCRSSHEYLFHLVKQPRYYAAVDEIREPYLAPTATRTFGNVDPSRGDHGKPHARLDARDVMNPLGKLPGSVWTIPSQPLTVPPHLGIDHFAAYPMELPRRCILGWSPPGICTECGEGRRPVTHKEHFVLDTAADRWATELHATTRGLTAARGRRRAERDITGYACACPDTTPPTRPAVVVDPFGGTGTTALVAAAYGRVGVSVDRSADYCRLATWRTRDPAERARALQVPKPPPIPDGQESLFDELEALA